MHLRVCLIFGPARGILTWGILSWGILSFSISETHKIWGILSQVNFFLGDFVAGVFRHGDFVAGGFCRWGILSLGDFVTGDFVILNFWES